MTVILVWIITLSTSGGVTQREFPMPNMETCLEAVKAAQIHVATGGDAESTVSLFCATRRP